MSDNNKELPFINHEYDGRKLTLDLCNIPDQSTLTVATFFEDAAKKLRQRHKVYQYEQSQKRKLNANNAKIQRLPVEMMDLLLRDYDFEDMINIISKNRGIERDTILHYWLQTVREIEKEHRERRDKQIVKMAFNGHSDSEIAKTVGLSDRQIRRIIFNYKKATQK